MLKEPALKQNLIDTFDEFLTAATGVPPDEDSEEEQLFVRMWYISSDIKYFTRPASIPAILKETDFLENLL